MRKFIYFFFVLSTSVLHAQPEGAHLIAELGCATCHSGLADTSRIREQAPELSHAGFRYNPAYLFAYLQSPTRVRKHIGRARMPNFHFHEEEALALTLFLESQRSIALKWPEFPAALQLREQKLSEPAEPEALIREAGCFSCHTLHAQGEALAPEMADFGFRLNAQWIREFLVSPQVYGVSEKQMVSPFFVTDVESQRYEEIAPEAIPKIALIAGYLYALAAEKRQRLEKEYAAAIEKYPRATVELGQKIFRSQNCAACHRMTGVSTWSDKTAPDLSIEGQRVQEAWLRDFLATPGPIRPHGFFPGSAGRMPDFSLTAQEIDGLADFLMAQQADSAIVAYTPQPVSSFGRAKIEKLLKRDFPCLGCHQLGTRGGRIGPNLSEVPARLQPGFVKRIITAPLDVVPHALMPRVALSPSRQELLINFLLQQAYSESKQNYFSLIRTPIHFPAIRTHAEQIYTTICASCHGDSGAGDGYNAAFLTKPPLPFHHENSLPKRSNDQIFDIIFAGGRSRKLSREMPAWGTTLHVEEIRDLVFYLRELCQCPEPGAKQPQAILPVQQ